DYDIRAIEADIAQATKRWDDDLKVALIATVGEERTTPLLKAYARAFPLSYREAISARSAVRDIAAMQALSETQSLALSLYRPVEADERTLRLRVYRLGEPVPLSRSLPVLENMGLEVLDELGYEIRRDGAPPVFIH